MKRGLITIILLIGCVLMGSCKNSDKNSDYSTEQLNPAQKGDPVAIIKTSLGDISVRLFPKAAPKTVENFINLANDSYYDGVIFHRVINDFMIQTGDPTGTGGGGDTWNGEELPDEVGVGMHHIRGAVSMANSNSADFNRWNTGKSQFFIVQNTGIDPSFKARFQAAIDDKDDELRKTIPPEFLQYYIDNGGTPHLDSPGLPQYPYKHAVFGQVIEGMDVVDAIGAVPVRDPMRDTKPIDDVIVNSVEITYYE